MLKATVQRVLGIGASRAGGADQIPAVIDFERRNLASPRRKLPVAQVDVAGEHGETVDWSFTGVLIHAPASGIEIGETVEGTISLGEKSGAFAAQIVRIDHDAGSFAGTFTRLDAAVQGEMRRIFGLYGR